MVQWLILIFLWFDRTIRILLVCFYLILCIFVRRPAYSLHELYCIVLQILSVWLQRLYNFSLILLLFVVVRLKSWFLHPFVIFLRVYQLFRELVLLFFLFRQELREFHFLRVKSRHLYGVSKKMTFGSVHKIQVFDRTKRCRLHLKGRIFCWKTRILLIFLSHKSTKPLVFFDKHLNITLIFLNERCDLFINSVNKELHIFLIMFDILSSIVNEPQLFNFRQYLGDFPYRFHW